MTPLLPDDPGGAFAPDAATVYACRRESSFKDHVADAALTAARYHRLHRRRVYDYRGYRPPQARKNGVWEASARSVQG